MNSNDRETSTTSGHFSALRPIDDWALLTGIVVEVIERGQIVDRGRVDDTTIDGCILWLAQEGASHRRLWERIPGRLIRIVS